MNNILPATLELSRRMDRETFREFVNLLLKTWVDGHEPAEAIKLLFQLDADSYRLQGPASRKAEGGLNHPKHRIIRYCDFFTDNIEAGETVLDVGCGPGALAFAMAETGGARVTAIDISAENIATAREHYAHPGITYIHGDATTDLPAGTYDVAVLSNVLEHVEKRVELLQAVQASASPGRFLLRVPQFDRDWRVPLKKELGLEWRLDKTHFTEYTADQFRDELARAGLRLVHEQFNWGEIWAVAEPA